MNIVPKSSLGEGYLFFLILNIIVVDMNTQSPNTHKIPKFDCATLINQILALLEMTKGGH